MAAVALGKALEALQRDASASTLRNAKRATDDAEVAALELGDADRVALLKLVHDARKRMMATRAALRKAAVEKRAELLQGGIDEKSKAAASIARDINDALRRATGAVTHEVSRSHAAANVVGSSARTLRATRDKHVQYGAGLKEGRGTLMALKRAERHARFTLYLSLAVFTLVVLWVLWRRWNASYSAAILRVATVGPLKIVTRAFVAGRDLVRRRRAEDDVGSTAMRNVQQSGGGRGAVHKHTEL